jgi:hypothetical protein
MTRDIFGRTEPDPTAGLRDIRDLLTEGDREQLRADLDAIAACHRRAAAASAGIVIG